MTGRSCDRLWEIDLYRQGQLGAKPARSFDRHLRICTECRTQMDRDEQLRSLARGLSDRSPGDFVLGRLRARVLRDAALGVTDRAAAGRRWALPLAFVALGVSASLVVAFLQAPRAAGVTKKAATAAPATSEAPPGPKAEDLAGTVVASSGARWSQAREARMERITLEDGAIRVHVRPQIGDERFLVILPDGEIEVRGTTFDVSVEHGATRHVYVAEGVVDLRLHDRATRRLSADEAYDVDAPIRPTAPAPREVGRPLRAATPAPTAATPAAVDVGDREATAYAAAVEMLRQGNCDQSAAAFHAITLAEPGTPRAEDASFLEAVALARAGRVDAAALAAEHHLASFPDSFRRKEAAILVARAASQRGDCDKARAVLAPWRDDSPGVRGALGSCDDRPR